MSVEDGILRFWRHCLRNVFFGLNPQKRREKTKWLKKTGMEFAEKIGIKPGDTVVDFGSGPGNYSIPIARLVGSSGMVYSVEKERLILGRLVRLTRKMGLNNISGVNSLEELQTFLDGKRVNVTLFYDVLQFMDEAERISLYRIAGEWTAPGGLISVYPKHTADNSPDRYFKNMTANDVCREIESSGYQGGESMVVDLWHGRGLESGKIWNFRKQGGEKA